MNDLINKGKRRKHIWTKKEYIVFINIISKTKTEITVELRLINLEKSNNNEEKEKTSWN